MIHAARINLSSVAANWESGQRKALALSRSALRPPCDSCGAPHGVKVAVHFPERPTRNTINDQLACDDCWADARHLDPEVEPEREPVWRDYRGRVQSMRFGGDCEL